MTESVKCGECGEPLEGLPNLPSGDRSPCPCCGSTRRKFARSATGGVGFSSHLSMLGKRKGKPFTFRESRRPDGRAASADRDDDALLSFSVSGSSPQGEEETLIVCKRLVQKLNLDGRTWGEPVSGDDVVDCETTDVNDRSRLLQVQVVRAVTDQRFWKQLNTQGAVQETSVTPSSLASHIVKTIKKKSAAIPKCVRKGLTLVLDATLLPGIAFDDVTEEFHRQHSAWASSLGFEGIWLVGPINDLIQRLDQLRSNGEQENSDMSYEATLDLAGKK